QLSKRVQAQGKRSDAETPTNPTAREMWRHGFALRTKHRGLGIKFGIYKRRDLKLNLIKSDRRI
ncbi:hypothetical protein H740_07089, partial [Campylobacter showae CC57C]